MHYFLKIVALLVQITCLIVLLTGISLPAQAEFSIVNLSPLKQGTIDKIYLVDFDSSGSLYVPITYSKISGSLPPGLTLTAVGTLSGKASSEGSFAFKIQAKDSRAAALGGNQKTSKDFTLVVGDKPPPIIVSQWESTDIEKLLLDLEEIVSIVGSGIRSTRGLKDVTLIVKEELSSVKQNDFLLSSLDTGYGFLNGIVAQEQLAIQSFLYGDGSVECGYGTKCSEFRTNISAFLDSVIELTSQSSLWIENPLNRDIDLVGLKLAIDQTPNPVLYATYKAFNNNLVGFDSNMLTEFEESVKATTHLTSMLRESTTQEFDNVQAINTNLPRPDLPNTCQLLLEYPPITRLSIRQTTRAAAKWYFLGSIIEANAENSFVSDNDYELGVHGYFKATISGGLSKKAIVVSQIIPLIFEKVAAWAGHKMIYCTALAQQQTVIEQIDFFRHASTRIKDKVQDN